MRIFPEYGRKERTRETGEWIWTTVLFGVIAVISLSVFYFGGPDVPPRGEGLWVTVRWIGLVVGVIAAFLTAQAVFGVLVAVTIGPERFIGLVIVAGIAVVLLRLFWPEAAP